MHLPAGTQYFCICPNESDLIEFYAAADSVFANFGIRIIVKISKYIKLLTFLIFRYKILLLKLALI